MIGKRKEFSQNCLLDAIEGYIPKTNFYRRLKPFSGGSFTKSGFED